jgi:hypothetical protein
MPDRKIPCTKCEETKKFIEQDGLWEYVKCEKMPRKPGWCRLIYRLKKS